ncbi:MAG: acyl-CoA dehydrogenase [Planctomycetota bacterium]
MEDLPLFGVFAGSTLATVATILALGIALTFVGAPGFVLGGAAFVAAWTFGAPVWALILLTAVLAVALVPPLRRLVVTNHVFALLGKLGVLPTISATEREAIEAGDIWIDRELFDGKPDFTALSNTRWPELSTDERALLDGPLEDICRATDNWQIHRDGQPSDEMFAMLREAGLFGMIIPKAWGGLELSTTAQSAVVQKLASRSLALAITVMVPNSLGPAELLLRYGTDDQKERWLRRLASGVEIPCFALTEAHAGSDAAAMRARGVVFKDSDGVARIRLEWSKRYITLAPIATVVGLAFHLEDPDEILGRGKRPGITCALIPADREGVQTGQRHDPLGIPFHNGTTDGCEVVIDVGEVIGGSDGIGRGWRMLMECLAAGRGIALPATSTGGAQLATRVVTAHAGMRKQFGLEIGRFEGIEEPIARIASKTWMLDGTRRLITGGLDDGAHPPVVTAMAKYQFTEMYRQVITDAMDVVGGSGIVRGPNNLLAEGWTGAPISITVEGANILTRTLMVFGQGAIRCHRYALHEIQALESGDRVLFDRAFAGHVGHVVRNVVRSLLLSVTRGRLSKAPVGGAAAKYWRRLSWTSASFATLADFAMAGLGGDLKRKERLTGRFADIFSQMLLITGALRRFEADGRRREDEPLLQFACEQSFFEIQQAFEGIQRNLAIPGLALWLRGPAGLWSRINPIGRRPSDRLGSKVARTVLQAGETRDRLTEGIHLAADDQGGLARLEAALVAVQAAQPAFKKLKDARRKKLIEKAPVEVQIEQAKAQGLIDDADIEAIAQAEKARDLAIQVDAFDSLVEASMAVEQPNA